MGIVLVVALSLALGYQAVLLIVFWRRYQTMKKRHQDRDHRIHRQLLYARRGVEQPIPLLAHNWLKELAEVNSRQRECHPEGEPSYLESFDPDDPEVKFLYGNARTARLKEGRRAQTVRVRLTDWTHRPGDRTVEVLEAPLSTHAAIIAALTALQARPVDAERLRKALPLAAPHLEGDMHECARAAFDKLAGEEGFRQALEFVSNFQEDALGYVVALLRYYRPEFDGLPAEERLALIARACGYTNEFLASLRKLTAFLEDGTPENDLRSVVADADRDVKAAMLRDVEKISYAAIGEKLGIARSPSDHAKGGHSKAAKMVGRGEKILEAAWGKEGWQKQVQSIRAEDDHWASLDEAGKARLLKAEKERIVRRVLDGEINGDPFSACLDRLHSELDALQVEILADLRERPDDGAQQGSNGDTGIR